MKIRNQVEGRKKMKHVQADFTKETVPGFTSAKYDIVIDKNVLDCFMSIPNDHNATAMRYVKNIAAQLKAGGLTAIVLEKRKTARFGLQARSRLVYRFTKVSNGKGLHAYAFPSSILACDKEQKE